MNKVSNNTGFFQLPNHLIGSLRKMDFTFTEILVVIEILSEISIEFSPSLSHVAKILNTDRRYVRKCLSKFEKRQLVNVTRTPKAGDRNDFNKYDFTPLFNKINEVEDTVQAISKVISEEIKIENLDILPETDYDIISTQSKAKEQELMSLFNSNELLRKDAAESMLQKDKDWRDSKVEEWVNWMNQNCCPEYKQEGNSLVERVENLSIYLFKRFYPLSNNKYEKRMNIVENLEVIDGKYFVRVPISSGSANITHPIELSRYVPWTFDSEEHKEILKTYGSKTTRSV